MHTRPPRRAWPWALAALASCLALSVSGQDAEPAPPPAAVWEYSQLAWTPEDTTSVLRQVTGADPLVDAKQLADRLKADLGELRFDPRLRQAIEARLQTRLAAVGAEGWEAYWVRESEERVGAVLLQTPTVLLKRRAP